MIRTRYGLQTALVISVALLATPVAADVDIQRYFIQPGGKYTWFPSSFAGGIPGCSPSAIECGFGIEGTFGLVLDDIAFTLHLVDLNLTLIGNEAIQNNPPDEDFVTSERVAGFLADRVFEDAGLLSPFNIYADQTFPALQLTDFIDGTILLDGGFDARAVDGPGLEFNFTAQIVPEPSSIAIGGWALAMALFVRRRSMRRLAGE